MKRVKRHKIKHEKPETSSVFTRALEEHDLAYYIHDRVELMHQVFSVLKAKDLKAMAPECVRRLTIDDLQELCTEELLGISSKRLLAVLDGAEPPSDTESSSQSSQLEAISLESISSDEEILSQETKKKRKHKRRDSKSKKHKSRKSAEEPQPEKEQSKASRAGLTVLELLELQARARAIRAQLQQEHAKRSEAMQSVGVESSQHSTDSEVEIKEEPAEVVEIISSDDEKPAIPVVSSSNKEPEKIATNKSATAEETTDNNTQDTGKTKKKKDKSKKKNKEKDKQKDKDKNAARKDNNEGDTTSKGSTTSKDSSKIKDNTDKNSNDSEDIIEIDTSTKSTTEDSTKITKRVNDLIITVPQQNPRKIKLNRNKMTVSIPNNAENDATVKENTKSITSVVTRLEKPVNVKKINSVVNRPKVIECVRTVHSHQANVKNTEDDSKANKVKSKDKSKKKAKKKEKRQSIDEDHDEITLQLSDSEKMDLLENFDKSNYDNVSSSSSDSESSSSDSSTDSQSIINTDLDKSENKLKGINNTTLNKPQESSSNTTKDNTSTRAISNEVENHKIANDETFKDNETKSEENDLTTEVPANTCNEISESVGLKQNNVSEVLENSTQADTISIVSAAESICLESESPKKDDSLKPSIEIIGFISSETENENENVIDISKIDDIPEQVDPDEVPKNTCNSEINKESSVINSEFIETDTGTNNKEIQCHRNEQNTAQETIEVNIDRANGKELSEGEQESSEIDAYELQPVVCISDDETPKKEKKKEKKSKKEKAKSDFRENADQNFYKDPQVSIQKPGDQVTDESDDIYEILELSDDSSCYEVEGTTLSKEPTVEEIIALSAKIDEIDKEEVATEQKIQSQKKLQEESNNSSAQNDSNDEVENISWKDRYLDSRKVKKVLSTSNILNALRKKNKELKKKIEESKIREKELEAQKEKEELAKIEISEEALNLEEGSIEQYNTLQACTKYVDPVPDPVEIMKKKLKELKEQEIKDAELIKDKEREIKDAIEAQVRGEMKIDAKQLLKIYKKLLKYNDVTKQKDPNKKKSKKKKRKKEKSVNTDVNII